MYVATSALTALAKRVPGRVQFVIGVAARLKERSQAK